MTKLTRDRLLKVGAGGAAAGLAMAAPGVAKAKASDDDHALFVHIDGVVTSPGVGTFKIDVDVAGTRDDLRGEGWDTDPGESAEAACIYVQSGRIRDDIVDVAGKVIFANDPSSIGADVRTRANAETGHIDWTFGPFAFTGSGRVIVARAKTEAGGGDD